MCPGLGLADEWVLARGRNSLALGLGDGVVSGGGIDERCCLWPLRSESVMVEFDVVIVGGGQAGVTLSYYLQQRGVRHIVLERDRPFAAWRNRWDDFRANTPNWMNTLPVLDENFVPFDDANAFATRDEIVDYLDKCLAAVDPPMKTGVDVETVTRAGEHWEVRTKDEVYRARCVAVCSGAMSSPSIPYAAASIPDDVPQMHSSDYRNPDQIGTGTVLIVGTASSGVQIGRLLCESERFDRVHIASSKVLVLPKRVLGIQTHRFIHFFGFFDVRTDSFLGRLMYSGLESKGDPIMRPTPGDLRKTHGAEVHGRFVDFDGEVLRFSDGSALDPEDLTIVWCTGFRPGYEFVELEDREAAFDASGYPKHLRGVVDAAPGLYFVGLRYQHTVASHDIYGVAKDAEFVAGHIGDRLGLPLTGV